MTNASIRRGRICSSEKMDGPTPAAVRGPDFRGAGNHAVTLYNWRTAARLQRELVPAFTKEPEDRTAPDKFTVVLKTANLNATENNANCRERSLLPKQVEPSHQAARDANKRPVLSLKEQKELESLRALGRQKIKALQKGAAG